MKLWRTMGSGDEELRLREIELMKDTDNERSREHLCDARFLAGVARPSGRPEAGATFSREDCRPMLKAC
jgi:hypothetical protein